MSLPKVAGFVRTFSRDFEWLSYSMRALAARGEQLCEVVVTVPLSEHKALVEAKVVPPQFKIRPVRVMTRDGYIDQQITKCYADQMCRGDYILHFDSDGIVTHPIELANFFIAGRPQVLFQEWKDVDVAQCWQKPTAETLRRDPCFETMRRMPQIYDRRTYAGLRAHCEAVHKTPFARWVAARVLFSEFNALGNFAHLYTPELYHFEKAGPSDTYPRVLHSFWSHHGIEGQRNQIEALMP